MLRFGAFEVHFPTGEVRKGGLRIRIPEQPLQILQALAERPGQLVTRDELRHRLWPADTFVDFERSLNAAVGKLRQSLSDSADRPLYIETVARKGYRFIAPVLEPAPEPPPLAEPRPSPPPPLPARVRRLAAGAVSLVLVAVCITLWSAFRSKQPPAPETQLVYLDLDVASDVSQPAIAPDGTTLAFIAGGRLAIRKLDQARIVPVAGTEGASSPFFSPDGRWLGYFARHQLRKVRVEGGESVTLCDAPFDRGGTWTDDGRIIAGLSVSGELSIVPVSAGAPRPFTSLKGEPPEVTEHRRPVALPGGKGILFVAGNGVAIGSLRVQPPDGASPKTLVEGSSSARYLRGGYLLFNRGTTIFSAPADLDRLELTGPASPFIDGVAHDHFSGADFDVSADGKLIYRRTPPAANRVVMWLYSSGATGRVLAKTGEYATPRLSPDGTRLTLTSQSDVLVYDLRREKMTTVAFGWGQQCCPVWSPGGEHVVFTSQSTLSWVRADGSGVMERLPSPPGTIAVPFSFSRDGRWLAFHRNAPRTGYDLWVAPVDATNGALQLGPPLPLLTQTRLQAAPAISPDGQWLAYGSDDETGRPEVYVMPFSPQGPPREGKWQVSTEGGRGPRWSPNGDTIYFRSSDDHLMAAAVFGKGNVFHSGTPRLWSTKRLANVGPQPTFDVAPDGKRIVAILDAQGPEPDETHLRVLLNVGAALLRQRVNQGTANAR